MEEQRPLPHSLEAERAVLGGLMLDSVNAMDLAEVLAEDDFYREAHGKLFGLLLEMNERGEPTEMVAVVEKIAGANRAEEMGGLSYVSSLPDNVPSTENIEYYARIVRERAVVRRLLSGLTEVAERARAGTDELQELLDFAEQTIFKVTQDKSSADWQVLSKVVDQEFMRIQKLSERSGEVTGISTGFIDMDKTLAGLQRTDLLILAARPAMGKCLGADSRITLPSGAQTTIADLVRAPATTPAPALLTLTRDQTFATARPSALIDDGRKPLFAVRTATGRQVRATAPHPFLTPQGWTSLELLSPGARVAVPRRLPVSGERMLHPDRLRALAKQTDTELPPEVFTCPSTQLDVLLSSMFEGGALTTGCEALARQLQHLLLRVDQLAAVEAQAGGQRWQVRLFDPAALPVEDDILWDEIVAIEPLGEQPVYDLTMPGTHNFVADDVCVHNTALALNMALNASKTGAGVGVFSLEMSAGQLATRLLCIEGRVDAGKVRTGFLSRDHDWPNLTRAAEELYRLPIFLDDTPGLNITQVRSKARRLKSQCPELGLIVLDYIGLMSGDGRVSRQEQIAQSSRGLKALAKELDVCVLALSQLNRAVEQRNPKIPQISDLRECVTGDTLVVLADGRRIPIAELVGTTPEVQAIDEGGRLVRAHSDKVWCVGERPIVEVRLRSGRAIRATRKHRLMIAGEWVRVGELSVGDRLAVEHRGDVIGDEIVAIEDAGEAVVYDLTVPGPASWLADGIISHNSGAIEQDADIIMFIYRDEYYNKESPRQGEADVIVAKQRNGPTGTVVLHFEGRHTRFDNLARNMDEGGYL